MAYIDLKAAGIADGVKTACFTGPRPRQLYGFHNHHMYDAITEALGELIPMFVNQGVLTYISGGAQGFDQLAFWAVELYAHDYDVSNTIYVPFEGQESRWVYAGKFGQAEYLSMLRRADYVDVLSQNPGLTNVAPLLFARNHKMVDDSDFVIALLAGRSLNWRTERGGTAECVRYAISKHKPVLALSIINGEVQAPTWLAHG